MHLHRLPLSTGEGAHLTEASPTEEADRLKLGTRGASAAGYHTAIYAQCHRVSSVSQSTQRWSCGPQLPRARGVVRAEDAQSGQDYNRPLALNSVHAVMAETELKPETAPEDPGDPEDPEVLEDPEDLAVDYWPRRRQVAEASSTHRLESVTGWREVRCEA